MRTLAVVLVGISLVLVLSSCSVKLGTPSTPAETTSKPETSAPADTAAPAATGSEAKVVGLVVGDKFDTESKEITNETTSFAVDTPEIFVNAGIKGLKTGAKITGTLTAVDVKLADGTQIKDQDLKSVDVDAPGEEATARFSFTPPEKGWPVGSYQAKVAVDGTEIDTVDLTVE